VAPAGAGTKGISYARRAATHALARLAYEDAAAHYQRALVVLHREPEPDKRTRCELLLGLGDARRRCGDVVASRAALEPAFGLARDLGEAEWMARAALDLGSSSSWGLWEDLWLPDETAVRLLEGALAALPEDDSVLRARVLGQLAVQFRTEDELHTRSEQALQMARRLHDPLALTDALGARLVAWPVAGADERLPYADELVAMAHAARLREPAALGRQFRVILLLQQGDVIEAEAELARFEQAARELRQPILLVHLQWLHSMWAMLEGRLEDAESLAANAFASHSRANPVGARAAYTAQLAFLRREQGRFAEMEPALRDHLAKQPRAYIWQAALLLLFAEEGRLDEARALLDSVVADGVLDLGDNDPHTVTPDQATPPTLSEAIALLRDEHAAQVLYQHLRPFAGRVIVTGLGLHFLGAVDYHLGRLAATVRRWADAERHFGDALARHQEMGAQPFLVRARFHFAESASPLATPCACPPRPSSWSAMRRCPTARAGLAVAAPPCSTGPSSRSPAGEPTADPGPEGMPVEPWDLGVPGTLARVHEVVRGPPASLSTSTRPTRPMPRARARQRWAGSPAASSSRSCVASPGWTSSAWTWSRWRPRSTTPRSPACWPPTSCTRRCRCWRSPSRAGGRIADEPANPDHSHRPQRLPLPLRRPQAAGLLLVGQPPADRPRTKGRRTVADVTDVAMRSGPCDVGWVERLPTKGGSRGGNADQAPPCTSTTPDGSYT
jgi:hypothetical protein